MQPFPFARKEPVNITDAIPLLSRIVRHYFGGSLIRPTGRASMLEMRLLAFRGGMRYSVLRLLRGYP
jgi:hypothetical protein